MDAPTCRTGPVGEIGILVARRRGRMTALIAFSTRIAVRLAQVAGCIGVGGAAPGALSVPTAVTTLVCNPVRAVAPPAAVPTEV